MSCQGPVAGPINYQTAKFQPFLVSDVIQCSVYKVKTKNGRDLRREQWYSLPIWIVTSQRNRPRMDPLYCELFHLICWNISSFLPRWWQSSAWYSVFCTLYGSDQTDLIREPMEPPQLRCLVRWKTTLTEILYFTFLQVYSSVCWPQFWSQSTYSWYLIWRIVMVRC